jgi:VanZ family protein
MRHRRAERHASSAMLLAWVWWAVVVYASLFPFSGWRWSAGMALWEPLVLPWPRYFIRFDIISNLLGYLPLGLLLAVAWLRQGGSVRSALLAATLAGMLSSYLMEVLQHLLPPRAPSLLDWVLNAAGAALGALLAVALHRAGVLRRWHALRERWLERGNAGAMALLWLWPVALLFPAAVPLGLGQVGEAVRDGLTGLLLDVPWAQPLLAGLDEAGWPTDSLPPAGQHLAVLLGMLSPCLLAFSAARRGWSRLGLLLGAAVLAVLGSTLSTALNFGPEHALAWWSTPTVLAMATALGLALALLWTGQRLAAGLGLVALTGLVVLVNMAPTDPYLAQSLQAWEQGRFVRFHGLAQWVGWLWPYAAIAWLLARLGRPPSR